MLQFYFKITFNPREYIAQQVSAIRIQCMYRMVAAAKKMRKLSAISGAERIVSAEKESLLTIQYRWRRSLNRKRIEEYRIISERIILENSAATAIVSESFIIKTALCFVFILLYNNPCSSCAHIATALTLSNHASVVTETISDMS